MYIVVDVKTTEADVFACYIYFLLADVIANVFVEDVITTFFSIMWWQMLCQVADGIATVGWVDVQWLMVLPQGRCYSHRSTMLFHFKF